MNRSIILISSFLVSLAFFGTAATAKEIPQAVKSLSIAPVIDNVETQYWSGGDFGEVKWRAILTWSGGREGCYELFAQWLDPEDSKILNTTRVKEVVCGQDYVHGMEFINIRDGSGTRPVLQLYSNGRPLMKVVLSGSGKYRVIRD